VRTLLCRAALTAMFVAAAPYSASAQVSHQDYEGDCQLVFLVARVAIGSSQYGLVSLEETLQEYTSPSVFRTASQRSVYERIIRDAYGRPIMVKGGTMPTDVYREVIDGFASDWAGSCERGELHAR